MDCRWLWRSCGIGWGSPDHSHFTVQIHQLVRALRNTGSTGLFGWFLMVRYTPSVVRYLAPHSVLGWLWRICAILSALIVVQICVNGYRHPVLTDGIAHIIGTVVVIGGPLCIALMWAMRRLEIAERRLQAVAQIDPVTGLFNRATFKQRLARALPQSGVLLLVDIDDFRGLNQRLGFDAGDLCLLALGQRCREVTRTNDILGRLEGAVIAIYLPGAPVEIAVEIADRLTDGIHVIASTCNFKATVSVGAVIAPGSTAVDALLQQATTGLERAKLRGRAHVILRGWPKAA